MKIAWCRLLLTATVVACFAVAVAEELENAAMRICFAEADDGFAINGIVNRLAGDVRFVNGKSDSDRGSFWSLEFRRKSAAGTNETVWVNNLAPCAVWRTADGRRRATFAANVSDVPQTVRIRLVRKGSRVRVRTIGNEPVPHLAVRDDVGSLSLDAKAVVCLEEE